MLVVVNQSGYMQHCTSSFQLYTRQAMEKLLYTLTSIVGIIPWSILFMIFFPCTPLLGQLYTGTKKLRFKCFLIQFLAWNIESEKKNQPENPRVHYTNPKVYKFDP